MEIPGINGMPAQTWTCPHCGEVWHTGRQYCSTCKHGMVQDGYGTWLPAGAAAFPQQAGQIRSTASVEASPGRPPEPPLGPPWGQVTPEAFQESVAAESQLHGEVTLLRERLGQVQQQAQREKTHLLEGVQRLLAPLYEAIRQRGVGPVEPSQLVPVVVELLLEQDRYAPFAGPQRGPTPAPAAAPPMPSWAEDLFHEVTRLRQEVEALRALRASNPPSGPTGVYPTPVVVPYQSGGPPLVGGGGASSPYPTWLLTDQRQAQLEQTLLAEQTTRGGMAYGEGR